MCKKCDNKRKRKKDITSGKIKKCSTCNEEKPLSEFCRDKKIKMEFNLNVRNVHSNIIKEELQYYLHIQLDL